MTRLSREQMRDYMRERRARIKAEMVDHLGGQCVACGATSDLEFDHVKPATKVFQISGRGLDRPRADLLAEVDKCQLLCRPHHIEKTREEAAVEPLEHGTRRMYRRALCRCPECRAEMAAISRRDKARRRGVTLTS